MPLHPQAQAYLDLLDSFGDPPVEESTPEAVRALRRSRIRPPTIELAEIRDVDAGGVPARLYRPIDALDLGLFVYLHGGGWVLGDLDTHDNVARALAAESGTRSSPSTTASRRSTRFRRGSRMWSRRQAGRTRTLPPSAAIQPGSRSVETRPGGTSPPS